MSEKLRSGSTVNRRRLLESLALMSAYGSTAEAADPEISLDALRNVSLAHGSNLSDDRLRVVQPVIERRLSQLAAFRNLEIDDAVAPAPGVLDK